MNKTLYAGTGLATVGYILCGMFGYITFAMNPKVDDIMNAQNILKAPYGNPEPAVIKLCLIGILFVLIFAAPFCVLPMKDTMEELLIPKDLN